MDRMLRAHARGWTGNGGLRQPRHDVFPARAGMDRTPAWGKSLWICVPRTRGDGPLKGCTLYLAATCSPHARGWTEYRLLGQRYDPVFPARAEMDRRRGAVRLGRT